MEGTAFRSSGWDLPRTPALRTRAGPFYTVSEANPTAWSMLWVSGNLLDLAGRWLIYDKAHHILYSSSWQSGLYRLATQ